MRATRKRSAAVLAAGLAGSLFVALPSHAGGVYKNKNSSTHHVVNCSTAGHTLDYFGPDTMWPPNHKTQTVTVTASGHDDDQVTLSTSVSNSDVIDGVEKAGSGNPSLQDASVPQSDTTTQTNTHSMFLRAERSGTSPNGRTYVITATATFSDASSESCTTSWSVTVPHDQGKG